MDHKNTSHYANWHILRRRISPERVKVSRSRKRRDDLLGGAAIHAEGFHARLMEFEHFERKFEECISKSAIQTKFEAHAVQGMQITTSTKNIMEKIEERARRERYKRIEMKEKWEGRLALMKEQLDLTSHDCKNRIKQIKEKVESEVAQAMSDEINRLGVLVNQFDHPFHTYPGFLRTYKRELHSHIASGLGKNLTDQCGSSLTQSIEETKNTMTTRLLALLPPEHPQPVMDIANPRQKFEVSYQFDIDNICPDFEEDLEFHFSLGWGTLVKKCVGPYNKRLAMILGADMRPSHHHGALNTQHKRQELAPSTNSNTRSDLEVAGGRRRSDEMLPDDELTLAVIRNVASLSSHSATGIVIIGGLFWRIVGWKLILGCGALYGSLYVIERLRWTHHAKEKNFKKQFVAYASGRLQVVVSMTSSNCSQQVMHELSSTFMRLCDLVDSSKKKVQEEISNLSDEIQALEKIENQAHLLGNKARWLDDQLSGFIREFGLSRSKI